MVVIWQNLEAVYQLYADKKIAVTSHFVRCQDFCSCGPDLQPVEGDSISLQCQSEPVCQGFWQTWVHDEKAVTLKLFLIVGQ